MKIKKQRGLGNYFFTLLCSLLYRLVLDLIYAKYISVTYGYSGFLNCFTWRQFWISLFYMFFIHSFFYYFYIDKVRPSHVVLTLLYYISYIPCGVLFAFGVVSHTFFIYFQIYYFILFCACIFQNKIKVSSSLFKIIRRKNISDFLCLFFSLIIIYVFGRYAHFNFYIGLKEVYSIRTVARSYGMSTILTYLFGFARVSIPVYIVYYYIEKKWNIFIVLLFIQICNFSIDGTKGVLFITLGAIIFGIYYSNKIYRMVPIIVFLFTALTAVLSYLGFDVLVSLIFRRVMFVPNQLNYYYYEYVSMNSPNYYSNLLRFIGVKSNTPDIAFTIGYLYFNSPEMSANTGLVGDALWNLGLPGLLLYPIVISIFLHFFDSVSNKLDIRITLIISLQLAIALISSSFTTILFTHGFVIALMVLYCLPRFHEATVIGKKV